MPSVSEVCYLMLHTAHRHILASQQAISNNFQNKEYYIKTNCMGQSMLYNTEHQKGVDY